MTPLKQARLKHGWRLNDVCDRINANTGDGPRLDTGNLSRIENSKQTPSPELAEALARLFAEDGLTEIHILFPKRFPCANDESVEAAEEPVSMKKLGCL